MGERSALVAGVRALLQDAAVTYRGTSRESSLRHLAERLDGPLRIAIVGKVKAGKSTLLNALVGDRVAATDASECTRVVTWYSDGVGSRVWLEPRQGEPVQVPFRRAEGRTTIDLDGRAPSELRRIRVEFPSRRLQRRTLVDTPGLASLSRDTSRRTVEFTTSQDDADGVDAVIYLLRHLHTSDVDFLEAFHGGAASETSPVNAIGVLSRADEVGGGRTDGMDIAHRIAQRYRHDTRVRALVQTVVPVSGLLGETGCTLRGQEFDDIAAIATLPPSDRERLLLSVDHVTASDAATDLRPDRRRALLERLGLAGLRLSVALVASGQAPTVRDLADRLLADSGLRDLEAVLTSQFTERRDVMKAHLALKIITEAVRTDKRPGTRQLRARAEELAAGAHEFRELELLNELRRGNVELSEERRERMETLLGASGGDPRSRLGLAAEAGPDDVRARLSEELTSLRNLSEDPLADRQLRRAAATLARTCEHLFSDPELASTPRAGGN